MLKFGEKLRYGCEHLLKGQVTLLKGGSQSALHSITFRILIQQTVLKEIKCPGSHNRVRLGNRLVFPISHSTDRRLRYNTTIFTSTYRIALGLLTSCTCQSVFLAKRFEFLKVFFFSQIKWCKEKYCFMYVSERNNVYVY